ncbi:phasin [Aureimonas endophytica]|uniref:Phasin n=1 Tax=Aureimonas endophytica TaxID=2027858 RepID=A0A916ZGS1_9HYPH|nr:phasin [Aureimonas endophytica]GGD97373.1 phasin [Aureimonas endophytica]
MSDTDQNHETPMDDMQRTAEDAFRNAQSALGMDPAKMTETFRNMTQKSMEQSREAYGRMKSAAEDATRTLESTMENAHQGSLQISKRAIDAMRRNADLGFSHLEKLMSAKSFAEVIELQTSYVRQQIEAATDQVKEMQALTQSLAQDMLKPGREAFQRATEATRNL